MNLICNEKERGDTNVILKSNTGGVGPFPVLTTPLVQDMPVVSVAINTSSMQKPAVLLTFTAQINMPVELNANLAFTIKKYIDDGSAQTVGGTYVFSSIAEILEAETFAFQFYDAPNGGGNYTYTVQLAANSFIGVAPGLTVTNATLSALAVDQA